MLSDISLGQFFPGDSPLHKCDPRIKLFMMLIFVISVFFAESFVSYIYLLIFVILLVLFSEIKLKIILKGIKPVIFISLFTAFINIFWTQGEFDPVVSFYFIKIYSEGLFRAFYMVIRIITLVVGTSVILTYTTTPMDLTDALESVLSPLKKIKLPVHEFSMMMSLSLRFVPTLVEETEIIMNAQKVRGANFESGGIIKRAKSLIPVLIPLFVSSFRRANDLAVAMECRCYTGGENRTKMNMLKIHPKDLAILLVFIIGIFGIYAFNLVQIGFGAI